MEAVRYVFLKRCGRRRLLLLLLVLSLTAGAQPRVYTTGQVHAHNDYEQPFPFRAAWRQGVGSIEADIFLEGGRLLVAHHRDGLARGWTLDSLYLDPLQQCLRQGGGWVYADTARRLQLLIDIKTAAGPTLDRLVEVLHRYPELTSAASLSFVISGNRPPPDGFSRYPAWIRFDGEFSKSYTPEQLQRVALYSEHFRKHTSWNGLGRLPEGERKKLDSLVQAAHRQGKPVRFWNAPDILNSWYGLMELGVDYINTDAVEEISAFLKTLPLRSYTNPAPHPTYTPKFRTDGTTRPVKNVILLIGDGTGLAQWQAGYTANRGQLNVYNLRHTGLSLTSSYDHYITDSAPGATAFSAGVKTNNRSVGVDHTGKKLTLLPEVLRRRNRRTGIITTGDLRDATPAAFYAHQRERSAYGPILNDLVAAPVDLVFGACALAPTDTLLPRLQKVFSVAHSLDSIPRGSSKPLLVMDPRAALPVAKGRGDWAQAAFARAVQHLSAAPGGFLLVLEGAQIDHGGHANDLPYAVQELLDFDRVVGRALQFADADGETLVVVVGDHETGGLSLTGGSVEKATIRGQFASGDHTALPVPVFAYGPGAQLFTGVYQNTEIYHKLLRALGLEP
ncbi:MAG TPA: alkaline phosphatase [Chitinophagaceae bacterium]|jgi:alkaline phosphatase|nr:alkaline phosphatase [Chitinophagaceae bacterium]